MNYSSLLSEFMQEDFQQGHYVITVSDDGIFSQDDVEVLCREKPAHVLPFSSVRINGERSLVFHTSGMRPMVDTVSSMQVKEYYASILAMMEALNLIRNNENLIIQNLLFDIGRIYYDPVSEETWMIYIPVRMEEEEPIQCEMAFRSQMIRLAQMVPGLSPNLRDMICERFANITLAFSDIEMFIRGLSEREVQEEHSREGRSEERAEGGSGSLYDENTPAPSPQKEAEPDRSVFPYGIQLTGCSRGSVISLNISTGNYIIGKSHSMANGIIDSAAVSRRHCMILTRDNQYYVEDMNSTNGSWLNETKLYKDHPMLIHEGDILTLADISLEVRRLLCYM